jgi:hypothetical protein
MVSSVERAYFIKGGEDKLFFVKINILLLIMGGDIENESQTVT